MSDALLIAVLSGLLTVGGAYINKRIDFKSVVKKAEIESKDDIYDNWKELYDTQKNENSELKEEYKVLKQQLSELQEQFSAFKFEMSELQKHFTEKEEGYLLQIEKLEIENDELKEENELLKTENIILKGGV